MPLTDADRAFIRQTYRDLEDRALEPDDPFYEAIHEQLDEDDPVLVMLNRIELASVQSVQFFSGFSGSGKTTELFRLRRDLRGRGYIVLYADALQYVNQFDPLTTSDMMLLAAVAFSDALLADEQIDLHDQTYWDRVVAFIKRLEPRLGTVEAKAEYRTPGQAVLGGISAGLTIKGELKRRSGFREALRTFLNDHLVDFQRDVEKFFEDGAKAIQQKHGADTQIVFLLDQLEQVKGEYDNWQAVIRAGLQVFAVNRDYLSMPYVHCVYSAPPWLTLLTRRPEAMTLLPAIPVSPKGDHIARFERGWQMLHSVVRLRLQTEGITRLFGPDGASENGSLERLIAACGGHVRDLLRMLREVLLRARTLPVTGAILQRVIDNERRDLLQPIAREDARLLHAIGQTQDLRPETWTEAEVERHSRFLDNHMALYFTAGESWYDVHPLIREEVARLAAEAKANG